MVGLIPVHVDRDAIEGADSGHGFTVRVTSAGDWGQPGPSLELVAESRRASSCYRLSYHFAPAATLALSAHACHERENGAEKKRLMC